MLGELSGTALPLLLILPMAGGDWWMALVLWSIPFVFVAFLRILVGGWMADRTGILEMVLTPSLVFVVLARGALGMSEGYHLIERVAQSPQNWRNADIFARHLNRKDPNAPYFPR